MVEGLQCQIERFGVYLTPEEHGKGFGIWRVTEEYDLKWCGGECPHWSK